MDLLLHPRLCDWRVFINPVCSDYQFFYTANLVILSLSSLGAALLLFTIVFRLVFIKDSPRSFFSGINGSLTLFTLGRVLDACKLAMVTAGAPRIPCEVLFFITQGVNFYPMSNHLNMIIEAIPSLKFDHFRIPDIVLNPRVRKPILAVFPSLSIVANCVLMSLSDHYILIGDYPMSDAFWIAGIVCVIISTFIPACVLAYFFNHFKRASSARLNMIKDSEVRANKKETKMLLITIDKINKAFYSMISVCLIVVICFILMVSFRDFFIIPGLSRTIYIFLNATSIFPILLGGVFIRADILRYLNKSPNSAPTDESHSLKNSSTKELPIPANLGSEDATENFMQSVQSNSGI